MHPVSLNLTKEVKVDDLLTEKAVCSMGGGRGGQPKLTISCVRKSKSTFTETAHTRLLISKYKIWDLED